MTKTVRITVTQDSTHAWILRLTDPDEGERELGSVQLNQTILRYLRSMLAMIEDELPE